MNVAPRWDLQSRAIVLCALLTFVTVSTTATALIWGNAQDLLDRVTQQASVYTRSVCQTVQPAVRRNDAPGTQYAARVAASDEEITRAVIIGRDGQLLAAFGSELPPKLDFVWSPKLLSERTDGVGVCRDGHMLLTTAPIRCDAQASTLDLAGQPGPSADLGPVIGYVGLAYDLTGIQAVIARRAWFGVLIALVLTGVGSALAALGMKRFMWPMQESHRAGSSPAAGERIEQDWGQVSDLMAMVAEQTPVGLIIAEAPEVRIRVVNAAALAIRGKTERCLLDIPYAEYARSWATCRSDGTAFAPEDLPLPRAVLHGEVARDVEMVIYQDDDTARWVLANAAPIRNAAGEIVAGIVAFVDITERKQRELELRAGREAAEAVSRARSGFLANVSHELRTPMNGIIGMLDLVLGTELTPSQREWLTTVMNCSRTLSSLLNDILDFSKIEAGKLNLDPVPTDLRVLVEETMDLFAHQANIKNLRFLCDLDPSLPRRVVTDALRLRQVLANLVSNALKFTEQGELLLSVRVESRTDDAISLLCSVRDTGIGIPPDRLDTIFDPFTQADGAITRKYGGTGLGLAVSRTLVELLGGEIWVESELGRGTVFSFRLSCAIAGNGRSDTDGMADADAARPPYSALAGKRALLVDNYEPSRRLVMRSLYAWGLAVAEAASVTAARLALQAAERGGTPFDLVIIDAQTINANERELERVIGGLSAAHQPRVLTLGAVDDSGELAMPARPEWRRAVSQPVKQSALYKAIMSLLGGAEQTRAQSATGPASGVDEREAEPSHGGLRVLVVEDNPVNRTVAVGLLEREGHRVTTAENGVVALERLAEADFDLVLMDVQMPRMDGYEATRRIRADERWRDLFIVAMTAHAMAGDREKCLEAGMNDYITKPFKVEELNQVVERWRAQRAASGQDQVLEEAIALPAATPVGPGADGALPPIDLGQMLEVLDGDRSLAAEVLHAFLGSLPTSITELQAAIAADDLEALQRGAHSLKGATSTLGAEPAHALARKLEQLAQAGNLNLARPAVADLLAECGRLREHIESSLGKELPG